jgi:hypothetical protein
MPNTAPYNMAHAAWAVSRHSLMAESFGKYPVDGAFRACRFQELAASFFET